MVLITNVSKVTTESHNKFFDVTDNGFFYYSFVNIFRLVYLHFIHIDIIKKILIFEHSNSFTSIINWHRLQEIVCSDSLFLVQSFFQTITQVILIPLMHNSLVNVEKYFMKISRLMENFHVM